MRSRLAGTACTAVAMVVLSAMAEGVAYHLEIYSGGRVGTKAYIGLVYTTNMADWSESPNAVYLRNVSHDGVTGPLYSHGGRIWGHLANQANPAAETGIRPYVLFGEPRMYGQSFFHSELFINFAKAGFGSTVQPRLGGVLEADLELPEPQGGSPRNFGSQVGLYILDDNLVPLFSTGDPLGADALFVLDAVGGEGWTLHAFSPTEVIAGNPTTLRVAMPFEIPPSPVADLAAYAGRVTMILTWTEPGQVGGEAAQYDARLSSDPITDANFEGATALTGEPVPGGAGTQHCLDVGGLTPCRMYYFAMKTFYDEVWSSISNVAGAQTHCSGVNVFCDEEGLWAGGGEEEAAGSSPLRESARGDVAGASASRVQAGENTLLLGAGGERADLFSLKGLVVSVGSEYPVRLREKGSRKAGVDHVALGMVDHDPGVSAFAGVDKVYLGAAAPVARATDSAGTDLTAAMKGSVDEAYSGGPGDYLLVDLGKAAAGTGLVIESAGHAPWAPLDSTGILVQKPEKGGSWTTLAHLHPRKEFSEFATLAGGSGTLRLLFLGNHSIRSLRGLTVTETATPQRLDLARAIQSRVGSVADAISSNGGATSDLLPGDTLTLGFTATEVPSGKVRDLFLMTTGAYATTAQAGAAALASASQTAALAAQPVYEFALGPARPNPSLGSVSISYSLAQESPVSLRVYNVAGRLVRTLVSGTGEAGPHDIVWDARDDHGVRVAAGVYFYRMNAGSWQSQRKVVFLER
jgi:hypothetical protein